jgi:hypothetical protein
MQNMEDNLLELINKYLKLKIYPEEMQETAIKRLIEKENRYRYDI